MMTRMGVVLAFVIAVSAVAAAEDTWKNVPVVDANCASKVKADPDKHDKACTLQCARSGFGILSADGRFLKFDAAGNEKWLAALKKSDKTDHLRATVTGTLEGETIKVTTLTMQ